MDATSININEPDNKQKSRKITAPELARAVSSIIVFGIPLITLTAAVIGYGMSKIYKKLT
jgi:hypothetical protein